MSAVSCFDALLDFRPKEKGPWEGLVVFQGKASAALFSSYPASEGEAGRGSFVRVCASVPVPVMWKDLFEVEGADRHLRVGGGIVLDPFSPEPKKTMAKKRAAFLARLSGDEREMLLAFAEERGIHGLRENEILERCRLPLGQVEALFRSLEAEGRLRILAFSPLSVLAHPAFLFLRDRILAFVTQFHQKHPQSRGVPLEKIRDRFDLDPKALALGVKSLVKEGKLETAEGLVACAGYKIAVTPEDKKILKALEKMCFEGEFSSISLDEIQRKFHLSGNRLQALLALLIERKKIVRGKDGFLLHYHWLSEIVEKVRRFRKTEMTVSDFKEMTGLSRKFAIPLLELLDEMGVTRRKGPSREIL